MNTGLKNLYQTFWLCFYKNQKRANCSFKKSSRAIHSFLSKNEQFTHKTKERIPNPEIVEQDVLV